MIFNCPGSDRFKKPYPENMRCPYCGVEAEIWTDEFSVKCPGCGKKIVRPGEGSCLDWCKEARQCVGDKLYGEYIKKKAKRIEGR